MTSPKRSPDTKLFNGLKTAYKTLITLSPLTVLLMINLNSLISFSLTNPSDSRTLANLAPLKYPLTPVNAPLTNILLHYAMLAYGFTAVYLDNALAKRKTDAVASVLCITTKLINMTV